MKTEVDALTVEASVVTNRGCVREHNEDAAAFVRPSETHGQGEGDFLAVVADGMGGHQAGEVASGIAVEAVRRGYDRGRAEPAQALVEALELANREIYALAAEDSRLRGMGTTCTALVIRRKLGYLAHVGDSRLYLLRDGELMQMTEDHSQVAELVRHGVLTEEQARHHQARNVVTRALGTASEVEVASWPQPFALRPGDRLLLSTDGLHDMLERDEIRDLSAGDDVNTATDRLLAAARERGGFDNISVVLLAIRSPGDGTARAPVETRKVKYGP